jgi:hypothetical protein
MNEAKQVYSVQSLSLVEINQIFSLLTDRLDTIEGNRGPSSLINVIYPVGSVYLSTSGVNPGTTFGVGTWVSEGSGKPTGYSGPAIYYWLRTA